MTVELFNNSFDEGEDFMTTAYLLDNCVDKEKRDFFMKSVLPHSEMEGKLNLLVGLNKSIRAEQAKEAKDVVKTLSKSFEADFANAGR